MASTMLRTRAIQTVGALTLTGAAVYSAYTFSPRFSDRFSVHAETAEPTLSFKHQFHDLPLYSSEYISPNVKRLKFSLPTPETTPELSPITSLIASHKEEGAWFATKRHYTPISIASDQGFIELLVKKYEGGKQSTFMHDLKPGDTVSFTKALSQVDWSYKAGKYMTVVCIAGGTGITPMWQLIRSVMDNNWDRTTFSLIYANDTEEDILLKDEIDALAREHPSRFRVLYTVTNGAKTPGVEEGYVSKEMVGRCLPRIEEKKDFIERRFGTERIKILVCGPPKMMQAVAGSEKLDALRQGPVGGLLGKMGFGKYEVRKI